MCSFGTTGVSSYQNRLTSLKTDLIWLSHQCSMFYQPSVFHLVPRSASCYDSANHLASYHQLISNPSDIQMYCNNLVITNIVLKGYRRNAERAGCLPGARLGMFSRHLPTSLHIHQITKIIKRFLLINRFSCYESTDLHFGKLITSYIIHEWNYRRWLSRN